MDDSDVEEEEEGIAPCWRQRSLHERETAVRGKLLPLNIVSRVDFGTRNAVDVGSDPDPNKSDTMNTTKATNNEEARRVCRGK
jgi:hypothetical protein